MENKFTEKGKKENELYRYSKLVLNSQIISLIIAPIFYFFSFFPPDASIFLRLIPIYLILIPLFLLIFVFIKRKSSSVKKFFSKYKKRIIIISSITTIIFIYLLVSILLESKIIEKKLIDKYLNYQNNYWAEIISQLNGPLASKKHFFPKFYQNAGTQLIFPGNDGLVSVCFSKDFKFEDTQFNSWLSKSKDWSGPSISIVVTDLSHTLSISKWVQVFSGNSIKISQNSSDPKNIIVKGKIPKFPPVRLYDPKTKQYSEITLLTIKISSDSLEDFRLTLRDIKIEEVESGKLIFPFLWRELDILGVDSLEEIDIQKAKLDASRELSSVLAGLNLGISTEDLSNDPVSPVLAIFQSILSELLMLLDSEGLKESTLQNFLIKNPILVSPSYLRIHPQAKLGIEYITDFIIEEPSPDGSCPILVMIENSNHNLFLSNNDLSAPLRHALKQVSDWRQWLRKNSRYASESLGIRNIDSDSPALVIIGRKKYLSSKNLEDLSSISKDYQYKTQVLTYDDVYERALTWYNNLKKLEAQFKIN
jgi:hypothetical protein